MGRYKNSLRELKMLTKAIFGKQSITNKNIFNNTSWMRNLPDNSYISEFSIPGTHDSCALYEPFTAIAKCQSYTVTDQLHMGIRFFDMRTRIVGKRAYMVHNFIDMGINFEVILKDILNFLKDNPSEAVLMSFKTDAVGIFPNQKAEDYLNNLISKSPDIWYISNNLPKLSEVRGKIILINRLKNEKHIGLIPENLNSSPPEKWLDNKEFNIHTKNLTYHIQDFYLLEDSDLDRKWEMIEKQFSASQNEECPGENIYFNFLSGLAGTVPSIRKVNSFIKEKLYKYLEDNPKANMGITIIDFADEDTVSKIINTNTL